MSNKTDLVIEVAEAVTDVRLKHAGHLEDIRRYIAVLKGCNDRLGAALKLALTELKECKYAIRALNECALGPPNQEGKSRGRTLAPEYRANVITSDGIADRAIERINETCKAIANTVKPPDGNEDSE